MLVCIDRLSLFIHEQDRAAMETNDVLATMKDLYGLTFNSIGRKAVVHVCSRGEMLQPIITLVKHSGEMDEEQQQQRKDMKKSAIRGYACEILLMVVRLSD